MSTTWPTLPLLHLESVELSCTARSILSLFNPSLFDPSLFDPSLRFVFAKSSVVSSESYLMEALTFVFSRR